MIHYNKAIAKNPDYWQYRLYRAFSLIKLGDNLQARKDAQFALSKQPDLITCYLALAEIEWVTGNRNESITAYNKAIELDQKHKPVDVYSQYLHRENPKLGRAIVYWDIGQYGKALADLDEVENSKDNRKSIALLYKALIYRDTGDEKKALEYARKWENSPKEDIDHWNQNDFAISVAECYIILQDKEKAFRLLKRYKPQTNTAYYDRGMMLEQIGRYKEAVEDFSICLKQTQDITHKKEIEQRIRNIKTKISN